MTVLRVSLVLTAITLMSRGLGLLRDLAITYFYGATAETDSFYAATSLTYAAYIVIGVSLTSVTIPFLRESADGVERQAEYRTISAILNITALILIVFAIVGTLNADALAHALVGTKGAESTAIYIAMLMPSIVLLGSAGILSGLLNQRRVYSPVTAAPAMLNLAVIAAVLVPWTNKDMWIAVMGTLIGSVLFFVIQIPRLYGINYRHVWHVKADRQVIFRFFLPVLPVLAVAFVSYAYTFIDIAIASRLADGIVTAVSVATKLIQLPQGVIATGLTAASFPLLAAYIQRGDVPLAARLTANISLVILFFALPVTCFMAVTSDLIIGIVFGESAFTEEKLAVTARILGMNSLSLPALALNVFLLRIFYAREKWSVPLLAFGIGFLAKCVISYALFEKLGADTVAISTIFSCTLTTLIMVVFLNINLGDVFGTSFIFGLGRIVAASALVTALMLATRHRITFLVPDSWQIGIFLLLAFLAVATMAVLLHTLLRAEFALFKELRNR
jgi:putative peptidoglycan lipid II flippase